LPRPDLSPRATESTLGGTEALDDRSQIGKRHWWGPIIEARASRTRDRHPAAGDVGQGDEARAATAVIAIHSNAAGTSARTPGGGSQGPRHAEKRGMNPKMKRTNITPATYRATASNNDRSSHRQDRRPIRISRQMVRRA
jgi:hypothetical protein